MLLTSVSMRQSPHLHIPDFTHLHIPAPTHHSLTNSTPMGWGGGRVGQSYQSHGTYTNSPHTHARAISLWDGFGGDGVGMGVQGSECASDEISAYTRECSPFPGLQ